MELYVCLESICGEEYCFLATHLLNGFVETREPSGVKKEHHQVWLQQRKFRKREISKREK